MRLRLNHVETRLNWLELQLGAYYIVTFRVLTA